MVLLFVDVVRYLVLMLLSVCLMLLSARIEKCGVATRSFAVLRFYYLMCVL